MTPKVKAIEIVDSYFTIIDGQIEFKLIKQCALIAVDEILKALPPFEYGLQCVAKIEFWNNVKKEIEAL
jgi:hypothetical protein